MKHFYEEIPGWFHFADCYRDAVGKAPSREQSTFVEIGCWLGRSTAYLGVEIINSGKPITLYVIDHFKGSEEHRGLSEVANLRETYLRNTAPLREVAPGRIFTVQAYSDLAAAGFRPQSVDFVFLDGGHDERQVTRDIRAWWPKVRPGGMLAGDDWGYESVQQAVMGTLGPLGTVHNLDEYPWWQIVK